MKVKRLLTATAIAASLLVAGNAHAASADEIENAHNHGYDTAAFEGAPGMSVTDPRLRAKLDAKYRNNPKMKKYFMEYYNLVAERNNSPTAMSMACGNATRNSKWMKQDTAGHDQQESETEKYEIARKKHKDDDRNFKRA